MLLKYLLFLVLSQNNSPETTVDGHLISKCDNVFFVLEDNSINIISYNGKLLNQIFIPQNTLDLRNISALETDYKYFHEKDSDQLKVVSISNDDVYQSQNDTLARINISNTQGLTEKSHVFKLNDTIFKFGGYGYWSNRDFFTYFSPNSKHWEYYQINPSSKPAGLNNFIGLISKSGDYYVLQGQFMDKFKGYSGGTNKDIWKFSFKNKEWTNLGVSNLYQIKEFSKINDAFIIANSEKGVILADLDQNYYKKLNKANTSFTFFGKNALVVNDTLFNYFNGNVISVLLSDEYLNFDKNKKKGIYFNSPVLFQGLYNAGLISIALILVVIVFLKYKKNQTPRISPLGIRYKGVSYHLKSTEKKILTAIIENEHVPLQQICDIVQETDLNSKKTNKIIAGFIEKLNNKIETILGVKEFIVSKKLETDQQEIVYHSPKRKLFLN